ncbi:hypothetical protein Trydic_g2184 [Trypoxylus dichotomus]
MERFATAASHVYGPRIRHKQMTRDHDDRMILRESLKNRRKTSSDLAVELVEGLNKTISAPIFPRRLQEVGLKGCKARHTP